MRFIYNLSKGILNLKKQKNQISMMPFLSQSRLASPTPYRFNHNFTLKPPTDGRITGHCLNTTCASDLISIQFILGMATPAEGLKTTMI